MGIYVGWNGDPVGGLVGALGRVAAPSTFRNRYVVAQRIGATPAFQETLRSIITTTKELIPVAGGDPGVARADSPLIMIGHSMGALMLESGLLALLQDEQQPLIRRAPMNTGAVQIKSSQGPVSFPDLILALNSAADSRITKSIQEAFERHQLEKVAAGGDISFSPPHHDVRHFDWRCCYESHLALSTGSVRSLAKDRWPRRLAYHARLYSDHA